MAAASERAALANVFDVDPDRIEPVAPAHVLVSYTTVERSDIDPKSKRRGPHGEQPTYPVAALVVLIRHAATGRELFLARAAMRVDPSPQAFAATISGRVAKMFERYPGAR